MKSIERWPSRNRNPSKGLDKSVIDPRNATKELAEFQKTGKCSKLSPVQFDLFLSRNKADIAIAKSICAECPNMSKCMTAAEKIPVNVLKGVLGGLSEKERKEIQTNGTHNDQV